MNIMSYDEIRNSAYMAFLAGEPVTSCPYPEHSDAARIWRDAYLREEFNLACEAEA